MNESQYTPVQNSSSPALQDDLILSVIEQLKTQVVNCTKINQDNKNVNEILTAELERYKNQEKFFKEKNNVDNASVSYEQSLEIEKLKHTLSEHLKEMESLEQKALGFQNSCYLKRAQQLKPKLYDGSVIEKSDAIVIHDPEETLMLAEESRSKMIQRQNEPIMSEKKVNTKPVDYASLNQPSKDFKTRFVPQAELLAKQAFWSRYSVQPEEPNLSISTAIVEVPKELPKVSMVNLSLKKLKFHLASFNMVVKERTTATAITEGTWGFEHTKACFKDDIIPFVKALKELFNSFDQFLIDELTEVQNAFNQMEQAVEQHCVEKNKFHDKMKNVLKDNERLLEQAISVDIVNIVVHDHVNSAYKTMNVCERCVPIETELQKNFINKECYDTLFIKFNTLKKHCKVVVNEDVSLHSIDPDLLKIDVAPLAPKLRNNRTAHTDYFKHTQEEIATLRELVESERLINLLNTSLDYACKYTKRIQELLIILQQTCPCITDLGNKLMAVTLKNNDKKIRLTKHIPSSGKTTVKITSSTNLASNTHVLSSTGVNVLSSASGSQPQGNTKRNVCPLTRISTTGIVPLREPIPILINFVQKFLGTVKFGNDHVAKIMGYGDYKIGNVTILKVYFVEGLGHNLFSIVQFCDSDLEVAFRQHTCFIRNLDGVDLLTCSRGNNLYTLSLQDMMASSPICLLSKASKTKSWLWHRRLSHLNFGAINHLTRQGLVRSLPKLKFEKDHLCSACAMGKSTKKSHKPRSEDTNQEKLYLLHIDLCGPMRTESVNGKKYILMIQVRLKVSVCRIRTDNETEFVNQTLREYYDEVGISHETSVARSPQQNEAVATAYYTQNRSIIRLHHGKTPYELLHNKLPDLSFLYVFGALCYPTNYSENLGKLQPKADIGIFIGYAPTKKAFRIYNRRTRRIVETIHVDFDELAAMASGQSSSGPVLNEKTPATISSGLVQKSSSSTPYVPPSRNDWDLLF
nr:integrase, catalytic region, zinc finger, CCHC-type, peptidase aspartic, catalytic [Tanacetum cinerariifolium]